MLPQIIWDLIAMLIIALLVVGVALLSIFYPLAAQITVWGMAAFGLFAVGVKIYTIIYEIRHPKQIGITDRGE